MLDNLWYGIKVLGSLSIVLLLILALLIISTAIIGFVLNMFKGK